LGIAASLNPHIHLRQAVFSVVDAADMIGRSIVSENGGVKRVLIGVIRLKFTHRRPPAVSPTAVVESHPENEPYCIRESGGRLSIFDP
jgi:hypothetical protein